MGSLADSLNVYYCINMLAGPEIFYFLIFWNHTVSQKFPLNLWV